MASRHTPNPYVSDSTGLSILAQVPTKLTLNSPLLASEITLPLLPLIHCWIYTSPSSSDPLHTLETARRNIVRENKSLPVAKAVLPRVHVAQDPRASALYIFSISTTDTSVQPDAPTIPGNAEGLVCSESYHFSPDGLYPCSAPCSTQLIPCPSCLSIPMPERSSPTWSSACLLPRIPLRRPFAEFMHAIRDRLIEDIAQSSLSAKHGTKRRHAVRYKQGVLLGPPHGTSAEWGMGWDHNARQRPLVYCELRLHLYPTRILVHPVMQSAHLLPFPTTTPSSISAGMPVTLLPHGTPAYYLNTYTGPLGDLTAQFDTAFYGLGVGDWKASSAFPVGPHSTTSTPYSPNSSPTSPTYVVAWLSVQNRHGEDKGMPIIWPSSLCVIPSSGSPHPRPTLNFLPMVPVQPLASPPVLAAKVSMLRVSSSVLAPRFPSDEQVTSSPIATSARGSISGPSSEPGPSIPQATLGPIQTPRPLRPSLSRTQTIDSLRAFRSLTITHKHAKVVAAEVSTYVDAVARERERERERLKREREGGTLSRNVSGTIKPLEKPYGTRSTSSSPKKLQVDLSAPKPKAEHPPDIAVAPALSSHIPPPVMSIAEPLKAELAFPAGGFLSTTAFEAVESDVTVPTESDIKEEATQPTDSQTSVTAESSNSFDPFSGFDSNWNQSSNDFMGMSLDNYDLSMGFSMGMNGAGDGSDAFNMDDGFGVFTDDDFNFFDSPATTAKAAATTVAAGTNPVTIPTQLNMSSLTNDNIQTLGLGPSSTMSQAHSIAWLNTALGEGMTPVSLGASTPAVTVPPELLPSTPTQTPPSHSVPVTPSVQLADQLQSVHIRRSSVSSSLSSSFDPIPFAQSHKQADGKYALGKFALATPPPDDEEVLSYGSSSKPPASSWHLTYRTATDPRIGIVRRLAGAKRKRLSTDPEEREDRRTSAWLREYEEWASEPVPEEPDSDMDAGQSSSEIGEEDAMDEDRSRSVSRAHTPPPSYLPLGPTLVQTQFQQQHLLPLCMPLRPPDTEPEVAIGMAGPLMSAPTPVSPAAILGAPSERSKALEGAAQILIKEVVENSVWGQCWLGSLLAAQGSCQNNSEIWMSDVRCASQLLEVVLEAGSSLTLERTFASDDMQELRPPPLTVAKSDSVIQVLPPALRFWEKLGLHPRAGSKQLVFYTFFEGSDDETETRISDWLNKLSAVYVTKNYGTHKPGQAAACTRDGLIPVSFTTFRKTLVSFVASLPEFEAPLVFYIITPTKMMNLASSSLREVFSAIKKVKKTYPDAPILMQLLPESLILGALHNPALNYGGMEAIADAVYNRALLPTERNMSRALLPPGEKTRALFSEPAFSLTRATIRKVTFSLKAHPSTLDVVERHYMLHVGYRTSECGKWLFAASIDERGDAHDLRAWLIPDDDFEQFVVNNIWEFAMVAAKKAHVEWRIIISRLGAISVNELHAWTSRLEAASLENQHLPPIQAHLVVAETEKPWNFIASDETAAHKRPLTPNRTPKHHNGAVFTDISSAFHIIRSKVSSMVASSTGYNVEHAFVADIEEDKLLEELQIRSLCSNTLVRVPAGTNRGAISMLHLNLLHSMHSIHASHLIADKDTLDDVTLNFYELAVLTRCRWKLNVDSIFPFQLAALETISSALSRSDIVTD
ncbi:mediator complex subunit 13 C-terminal-domain-containing protein [Irpex rosettiformis]|uniref:Mediator complex subunit 13 C-terminal-domain-containing protein n=1 Tax=Irpex rosettiformis TaxID=378272 RepID=A0ACB8UE12_9APHY|nr:mediator complex subunit 13 C-terminal-domain-containing protein [Irpex rosettiformis]